MRRIVLTILVVALAAAPAAADPAADAIARGKKAFKEEKFAEAVAEFKTAHSLKPDPKLLYAIAQAQRLAGDCEGSIATYEEFLATKPNKKLAEYSKANIERCKEDLAKKPPPVKEPPPAKEPPPEPPATTAPSPLAAGPTAPATAGPAIGPSEQRDDRGRPWTRDWLGHGLVVGGVAAATVGTMLWLGGRGDADDVNGATDHQSFLDARDAASSAVTKQRLGIGLGVAGAALIVGGVVHYKLGGKKEARVTAVPTPGGAAVYAGVRF